MGLPPGLRLVLAASSRYQSLLGVLEPHDLDLVVLQRAAADVEIVVAVVPAHHDPYRQRHELGVHRLPGEGGGGTAREDVVDELLPLGRELQRELVVEVRPDVGDGRAGRARLQEPQVGVARGHAVVPVGIALVAAAGVGEQVPGVLPRPILGVGPVGGGPEFPPVLDHSHHQDGVIPFVGDGAAAGGTGLRGAIVVTDRGRRVADVVPARNCRGGCALGGCSRRICDRYD